MRSVGQHETQWPNDVWRLGQQYLALGQCLAHQTQFVMLEVAQPAMYQLAAGRRRVLGQVALLAEEDRQATTCGVCRNSRAVDAAAHNGQVVDFRERCKKRMIHGRL